MEIEATGWSGEGTFTRALLDELRNIAQIAAVRVEDAPSTRSDFDYNFISNEIFVSFHVSRHRHWRWWLGLLPIVRSVLTPAMTIRGLAAALGGIEAVGPADVVDDGMIQYLRTERIVPPYQTRGFKLVEMVRIYTAGTPPSP